MTPDLAIYSDKTVGKRIASNASMIIGAKMVAAIIGAVTLAIAGRSLDLVAFGTVTFLHAYMLFFGEVTTFKTWQSLIRFGANDLENNDAPALSRLIKFGLKLDFISVIFAYLLSLLLMSFVVWLVSVFPSLGGKDVDISVIQKYAAIYCLVVLLRQTGTADGILRLFDRFNLLAVEALVMPVLRLIGSIYAAWAGYGVEGFLAVWFIASGVSYIVVVGLAMFELWRRRLLGMMWQAKQKFLKPRTGLWSFVIKSNIDSSIASGFGHLPQLLVMAMFGAAWSGLYKVAEEVAKLLSEGFKLLDQVIYPELAKLIAQGNATKIWRIVVRAAIILMASGIVFSAVLWFVGPYVLPKIFGEQFTQAVPLAALLVPAAVMLGIAAPLYPIFYAANKPERAIYVRGASLIVYILAFIGLSFTIGEMAPGWAMIVCNLFAIIVVVIVARHTLDQSISEEAQARLGPDVSNTETGVYFVGQSDKKLWGLPISTWQRRAYLKVGAEKVSGPIVADLKRVLSSSLHKAFIESPNTALVVDNEIVASNGLDVATAKAMIGADPASFKDAGILFKSPDDLDDGYIKALRKTEKPYALNIDEVGVDEISRRQYASSYKGITDFVTKFFWPVPAFYATRFCAWLRLTPNMVTTLSLIMMIVALYYFWQGQWALGFITGWFMTFLDTVDGKLARTTMTYSAWGNIYDHGIDLIHPPMWYAAWFIGLGGVVGSGSILEMALIAILIGYVVDRLIEGIFLQRYKFHIHVWRPFNSALRFVIARRNPNMFIFMLGIMASGFIAGAGKMAFMAIAAWVWICILLNLLSLIAAFMSRKPVISWMEQ